MDRGLAAVEFFAGKGGDESARKDGRAEFPGGPSTACVATL